MRLALVVYLDLVSHGCVLCVDVEATYHPLDGLQEWKAIKLHWEADAGEDLAERDCGARDPWTEAIDAILHAPKWVGVVKIAITEELARCFAEGRRTRAPWKNSVTVKRVGRKAVAHG